MNVGFINRGVHTLLITADFILRNGILIQNLMHFINGVRR